jgi:hypothetical protein
MTPALQNRVQHVALRARRLVRAYGLGWFLAACCVIGLAFGWLDYLLRFQDPGVRWIISAAALALVAWCFWRYLVPTFRYRCSDLQAACRIERRFPELGDRLSSAVAFADQRPDDVQAGSAQLRRSVVAEAEAAVQALNLGECLDKKSTRRAMAAALIGCSAIAALALWDNPSVALAARRITCPWQDEQWPRRHVLRFVTPPRRLARGQDFEIELVDIRGALPERVEIHYWFDGDDEAEVQTFEMQPLGDKLAHRLSNVSKSFRFRATGGDDQRMDWLRLQVLQPPKITTHVVELIPPSYTAQEPYETDGAVRAVVGSRAAIQIRVDKQLSDAMLLTDTMPDIGDRGVSLTLDEDRKGFYLSAERMSPWIIEQSGVYAFRMIDVEGLESGANQSWDVEAITDQPPTVSLVAPASNLFVTTRARVPTRVLTKDDFAIHSVELRYTRSDDPEAGASAVSLFQGPERAARREVSPANSGTAGGVEKTLEYAFDLELVQDLEPGDWLDLTAMAMDYHLQSGTSSTRRLTLISPEQLEDRLSQRQAEIVAQIAEVAQLQRETRSQASALQIQLEELQRLHRQDVDHLQSIELSQRQVLQRLAHPVDGILAQIAELLEELQINRVDNTEVSGRMSQVGDALRTLVNGPLPAVQQEIVKALKIAREDLAQRDEGSDASAAVRDSVTVTIDRAHAAQDRVVEALEKLLGELSEWDSYRQLAREVGRLRREQEETRQQTERLRLETLPLDPQEISSAQQAEQRRLAERQGELSRSYDRLQSRMTEMRGRLEDREPLAAATLRDALEAAGRMTLGSKLREARDQLRASRLGQATDRQGEIVDGLRQLQDVLANRRENTLDRELGELQAAAAELSELEKRQDELREKLADPQNHTEQALRQFAATERDLAEQIQRLANRLQRLRAGEAGDLLQRAAENLESASANAEQGDISASQRSADVAASRMREAQQRLRKSLGQTQQDLLREQLTRYQQLLAGALQGQQAVLESTERLHRRRPTPPDSPSPQWQDDTMQVAEDELGLQQVVKSLADQIPDAQVLNLVLREVAQAMSRAAQQLRDFDTGSSTQDILRSTVKSLQQVLAALETAKDSAGSSPQATPGDAQDQKQNAFLVAQLKMLRDLQQTINDATRQLDQLHAQGQSLSEVQQQRRRDLADRQGHVARLFAALLKEAGATKADDADARLDQLDQILELD